MKYFKDNYNNIYKTEPYGKVVNSHWFQWNKDKHKFVRIIPRILGLVYTEITEQEAFVEIL